jgi:uncharacterized protein (TIGR03086 family)
VDQLEAHQRAQDAFAQVLANVKPEQLDDDTPCTEWTVSALIDHVIGGNGWVQSLIGAEPRQASSDDLVERHRVAAEGAQAVFAAPDGLTRTFKLPFGDLPGSVFIGIRTSDVLCHAWDLAKATGQPTDLDGALAVHALEFSRGALPEAFRGEGRPFHHIQPCDEAAPNADQLAAFLGRAIV